MYKQNLIDKAYINILYINIIYIIVINYNYFLSLFAHMQSA